MECAKIRDLLSEYIDDALDAQTKALIDAHLRACPKCHEELASLKTLIRELGSLESLKAPDDFLEKLHERLEPRFTFRKIVRLLFVPGKVKIPLEFAAATAMAVLIFSILYIQHPEKMIPGVPESTTPGKMTEKTATDKVSPSGKAAEFKSKPVLGKATAERSAKKQEIIELTLLLEKERSGDAQPSGESLKVASPRQRDAERPRTARHEAPKAEIEKDTLKRERQAMGFPEEEKPVIEGESQTPFSISNELLIKVKELIRLNEGRILSIEYGTHTERPKSIHAKIPAGNYKSFCDKLNRLAILYTLPPSIPENTQGTIQIRIRFKSS